MANVDSPNGFRAIAPAGQTIPMYPYVVRDNVALAPGDAVIMMDDGKIDIALATSTEIFGVCQSKITAGVGNVANVVVATPDLVFSGQCDVTSANKFGNVYDIIGATGAMQIDDAHNAIGVVRIIGLEGGIQNEAGANARVLFTWNLSQFN